MTSNSSLVKIDHRSDHRNPVVYNQSTILKGVPVKMSRFVFTFCIFPTSFDACYSGLLSEILQAMLEWPKLGFYPKLCVDLVDLSNREQKRQKTKMDIFTGTPFSPILFTIQML